MANDQFNEGSTVKATVSFFDETDTPVTPTSARYRVDDLASGTPIVPATSMSGLSTTATVTISAAQNAILSDVQAKETRILTVDFLYATTKHGTAEYRYDLVNLRFAPVG